MGTKGAWTKILTTLHSHTNPNLKVGLGPGLEMVLGSKVESNDVAKGSHEQKLEGLAPPNQHDWHGRTNKLQRFRLGFR